MKQQFTTAVQVSGRGDSRQKAFADALSRVQNRVLKSSNKVLLRIEPLEVTVVCAQEQVRREKFLFLWLARERRYYSVELEVTVSVSAIDTDKVDFATK